MHVCLVACLPWPFVFFGVGRQVPFLPKPKPSKTGTRRRSGTGKSKRKGRVVVGETGSELDVYMKV